MGAHIILTPTASTIAADGVQTSDITARYVDGTGAAINAPGAITLTFGASPNSVCTLTSASATIQSGLSATLGTVGTVRSTTTSGTCTVTGTASGGFTGAVTSTNVVTTTLDRVVLPSGILVGPGSTASFAVLLTGTAPLAPVTVSLSTVNAGVATVTSTVTIAAGSTSTSATIVGVAAGQTTVSATAAGYVGTSTVATAKTLTMDFDPSGAFNVYTTQTSTRRILLSDAAPIGGVVVALSIADPTKASISVGSVVIAAGQLQSQTFDVTWVSQGTTTLTATATGIANRVATLYVAAPSSITASCYYCSALGAGLSHAPTAYNYYLTLSNPAPVGGLVVNLTSSDQTIATVPSVTVPAGQTSASFGVTGILPGVIQIAASAPGWSGSNYTITVYPIEVRVQNLTTTRNTASAPNTIGAQLTCNSGSYCGQATNTVSVSFAVTSQNPAGIASLTTASLTIPTGSNAANGAVIGTPIAVGSYTITPTASGSASVVSSLVTVTNALTIGGSGTVGTGLTLTNYYYVAVNDTVATAQTITLTSTDATKLLVATATIPAGSTTGYFAVSGVAAGAPTVTASKSGWTTSTPVTVTIAATQLSFLSGPPTPRLTTSGPATFYVYARCGTNYCGEFTNAPVVTLTSSAPAIATVAVLSATAGSQYFSGTMTPVSAGTYTITAAIPGFATSTSGTLTIQ